MFHLRKYHYIIIFCLVAFSLMLFFISNKETNDNDELVFEEQIEIEKEEDIENIKVDIKGAVNNPGVYELSPNSRVLDAIKISGGLTLDADTSVINLSKNLTDEMVIIIYTKDEIAEMKSGDTSVKYIEKECVCPKIENDACIDNVIDNNTTSSEKIEDGKISLNNATLDELMTLDGIGEKKAQAIIDYRNENSFKSIDEIMEVDGIGSATYEKIKDRLTL